MVTNKELGDAIGVSPSMASRIRNGKRVPGVKVLGALSAYLGVDLALLVDAHGRGAKFFGEYVRVFIDA